MTKASNIQAIEDTTGMSWEEWLGFMDSIAAADLPHKEIAAHVANKISALGSVENSGWWAQSVTVAYEQHVGRRAPGQRSDGTYEATVSKTLAGDMDAAMGAWLDYLGGRTECNGVAFAGEPSATKTQKRRHWACNLTDGTRVNVDVYPKTADKSILSIVHAKLAGQAVADDWRTYWKTQIASIG